MAFSPDGNMVAAGGTDGMVRLFNATNGSVIKEFLSVSLPADLSWCTSILQAPAARKNMETAAAPNLAARGQDLSRWRCSRIKFVSTAPMTMRNFCNCAAGLGEAVDDAVGEVHGEAGYCGGFRPRTLQPLKNGTAKLAGRLMERAEAPVEIAGLEAFPRRFYTTLHRSLLN